MTENKNYTNLPQEEEELEIDLMEYARKLWAARKLLLKVAGIAVIVGVVIALTTPKQYTVNVTLAPEAGKSSGGSLSGIASMLGVGGFNMGNDADALNVTLYPDIVASTPFILDLMDTPVKMIDEELPDTTLVGYLEEYTSSSLMGTVMSLPFKAIGGIMSLLKSEEEEGAKSINPFHLTQKQAQIVEGLKKQIVASVDKKTGVTTVSVTMQDPMVAAMLTDTVIVKLKEHITQYRVSKAADDCKYYEQLYNERRNDYYKKQDMYAKYMDANKNVVLQSVRIEQERLQNEMNSAFEIYKTVDTQLQMARAKVQEAKPVFAIVEPASVPLNPSGTSRKMILIGIVFLAVAGAAAWVLFGQDLLKTFKEKMSEESTENSEK